MNDNDICPLKCNYAKVWFVSLYLSGALDFDLAFGDDSAQPFYESDDEVNETDGV